MIGLSTFVATKRSLLGFDYSKLMSAAGGALSAAGGGSGGGGGDAAVIKAQLEAEKARAQESANTWKLVGIIGIVVVGGVLLMRPKAQAAT